MKVSQGKAGIYMKILLINGSSRPNGCTYTALREIADTLESGGAETEILFLGSGPVRDCTACRTCQKTPGRCVFDDDMVNPIIEKAREADGFVFGTPVYYAHPSGRILSVLDRVFYAGKDAFAHKPGAAVASARRAGTTASVAEQIPPLCPDAHPLLPVLEHGPRQHAGGGAPGRGGNADHAEFGPKPALDGPVHPGGKGRWTPAAPGGERGPDQLHPLKRESPRRGFPSGGFAVFVDHGFSMAFTSLLAMYW
jgi:multimeric flavodoxin WrbA